MTANETKLFFAERVDELVFIDHCTRKLCATVVKGERRDLRWKGKDATVWARDVCATLAGDFVVSEAVRKCLGAVPESAIVLEIGEHPSSNYAGFLVAIALLGRWGGCVTTAEDPAVFSSKNLRDASNEERLLRSICGDGT